MAKTSSTVHLEDSTWREIYDYMETYGCTRNEAIERMFTERRTLFKVLKSEYGNSANAVPETKKEADELTKSIINRYDDMPE